MSGVCTVLWKLRLEMYKVRPSIVKLENENKSYSFAFLWFTWFIYIYNVLCVSLRPGTKACWWPSSSSICRMTVKWWGWTSDGYWPSLASRWRQWVWWTSLTSNGRLSWREWLFVCCCFFPLHSISGTLTLTFFPACLAVCRSFTSCLCRWWSWYVLYTPNFVCAFIETLCLCAWVRVFSGCPFLSIMAWLTTVCSWRSWWRWRITLSRAPWTLRSSREYPSDF